MITAASWKQRGTLKLRLDEILRVFNISSGAVYLAGPHSVSIQLLATRGFSSGQLRSLVALHTEYQQQGQFKTEVTEQKPSPPWSFLTVPADALLPEHLLLYPLESDRSQQLWLALGSNLPIPSPDSWNTDKAKVVRILAESLFDTRQPEDTDFNEDTLDRFSTFEDSILILDSEGRIQEANIPALKMLGYSLPELETASIFDLYPKEEEKLIQSRLHAMNHQDSAEFTESVISKEGFLIPLKTRLSWKSWNGHRRLTWISQSDNSGRNTQQMQSHASEFYKSIYQNASVPVVFFRTDGQILKANQPFHLLTECSEKNLNQCSINSLIHHEDLPMHQLRVNQILEDALNHSQQFEMRIGKPGNHLDVDCLLLLIRSQDGKPLYFIMHARNISERKQTEKQLQHLATHDPLTDLPNRTMIQDRFNHASSIARRECRLLGLIYIDLDDFKQVNDTFGHNVGDKLLRCVSERLHSSIRESDTLARIGGDEFIILLEGIRSSRDALTVLRKSLGSLSAPIEIEDQVIPISASAGISIYPFDGKTLDQLLRLADMAMYQAKHQERGFSSSVHIPEPVQLPLFPDSCEGEKQPASPSPTH